MLRDKGILLGTKGARETSMQISTSSGRRFDHIPKQKFNSPVGTQRPGDLGLGQETASLLRKQEVPDSKQRASFFPDFHSGCVHIKEDLDLKFTKYLLCAQPSAGAVWLRGRALSHAQEVMV